LVDPTTAAIANGVSPAARCPLDGLRDRGAVQPESLVGRDDDERLRRETQQVERSSDREVRLVRGVDADAIQQRAARWPARTQDPPEVDVAGKGHPHEVGHHAAGGEQPERRRSEADQVAQPADDLLLDEGRERAGVPDIDALIGHLGEQLAHHRDRERRRREVAELARVLRVHLAAREAVPKLGEDGSDGSGRGWRGCRAASRAEEPGAELCVGRRIAHRPFGCLLVQEVEGDRPRVRAEPLHRGARGRGIAVGDELGFGVPVEAVARAGHGPRW